MTLLSTPQQTALQQPLARAAYFLELQFSGGTSRLTSFNQSIDWGGYTWSGMGQVLSLSAVSSSEGADPRSITVTIAAAAPGMLALAVGPVEEYRGRIAKLYMAPLDAAYQLVGTPVLAWRGVMDTAAVSVDGEDGSVQIKCENAAYALKRRPALRVNAAQHKLRYPGETGLDYLTDLIANPQLWLSRRFQGI